MNWTKTELTQKLGIQYPIVQAPMAGGITTPELVSSVSNFGGIGNIGAGYMGTNQLHEEIHRVKQLTAKTFGVNLFVPDKKDRPSEYEKTYE